ncbi:reverse transcriptase [Tanacetum coccineum]
MNGFLVSQNAISNELNKMKNGEGTGHNGGSHNSRNGGRGYGRMSKIELSKFHVDDVKGWVYRCRQLFKIDGIDNNGRMELVFMHVYDKALIWHQQFCIKLSENCPWELYEKEEKFEELLNMVELDEKHAISLFLGGLKKEIHHEGFGTVGKHVVHILVDCRSTHNFLDKNVAQKLGCPIRPTVPLAVTVANGNNLVTTSKCKNFKWKFGNNVFTTDVMLLPLGVKGKKVAIRVTHKSNMEWMNDKGVDKNMVQAEFHSMALCVFPANAASCMQLEGETTIVVKKDNSQRMCVDYRQLNKQTVEDKLPIPVIEELIDDLHGAKGTHKLYNKPIKCVSWTKQVEYFGHVIFEKGVATDPSKIQAMANWPIPCNIKQLGGFLDLTDYYRIFIKGYAIVTLKQDMTSTPVLRLPDFSKEFIVETDASGVGIGAWFKHWRNEEKGVENVTADALSRMQNPVELVSIVCASNVSTDLYQQVVASWEQDLSLKRLITKLQANSNVQGHYTWTNP